MGAEAWSGPARVVAAGTVTCFGGHPLGLRVDGWEVVLRFRSDPSVAEVAVETRHEDGAWVFECVNFDGPEGRGSAVPVLLGEEGEVLVFLHFRVFRYGRTEDRTVHYTFYRVPKSEVGWTPVVPGGGDG